MEDYKKKYEEALERAKNYHEGHTLDVNPQAAMEYVFPELKKSEDDRIRKALLNTVKYYHPNESPYMLGISQEQIIAWLEKQGEQKPTDKVEPKFEIEKGKWYVCIKPHYTNFIVGKAYLSLKDRMLNSGTMSQYVAKHCFRLWTIQDTKPGDVLEFKDHERVVIGIVSFVNKKTEKIDVSCLLEDNKFKVGNFYALDTINPHPATKEQCKLLFYKMKEAGYEWDDETKELNKIEQSLTWSEEDEKYYDSALWHIEKSCGKRGDVYNWLKSIKERIKGEKS